jgi:HTH-type transcriptional regulator/antitoxin HigA
MGWNLDWFLFWDAGAWTEMLELKMYERNLKQKDMAMLLGISATRLSEVMQGKRKVNMDLAKRLYPVLEIDAAFILEQA